MSEDERDFSSDAEPGSGSRGDSRQGPEDEDEGFRTKTDDDTSREWGRIPVDVDEGDDGGRTNETDLDDENETGDEVFGPEPSSTPIEPGNPTLENALFVVLGAIAMGLVLFRLVSLGIGG